MKKPTKQCHMCLMPFSKDTGNREHENYCSICYKNGDLVYKGNDRKEFQRMSYEAMVASGMNKLKARIFAWSIRFAPHWKENG